MRVMIAAVLAMTASGAMADEIEDAHRLALQGRDSYWNCLAREYSRDATKTMSEQDFTRDIASVCPSERQNFRVTLVDYLSMQFPDADAGAHLTTANKAIELAQKDIVTAFVQHKAAANSERPAIVGGEPIPAIGFSVISICTSEEGWLRMTSEVGSGHFGRDRRGGRAGGRDRLRADRAVRKAGQAVQQPVRGAQPAAPAPRGPVIREVPN